jgi:hypothetical protein
MDQRLSVKPGDPGQRSSQPKMHLAGQNRHLAVGVAVDVIDVRTDPSDGCRYARGTIYAFGW